MSVINFIPNQPILFETDTQYYKNRDKEGYAQLMQQDDVMCVQWQQDQVSTVSKNNAQLWTLMPMLGGVTRDTNNSANFTASTGWTIGANWTISGGKANKTNTNTDPLTAQASMRVGGSYIITYTVSNFAGTNCRVFLGTVAGTPTYGSFRSANGTYTELLTFNDLITNNYVSFQGNGTLSIDNVIIQSIPYDNTALDYWTTTAVTSDPITHNTGNTQELFTVGYSLIPSHYSIEITIANSTAGTITPTISGVAVDATSGNGTFIRYANVTGGDSEVHLLPSTDFDGDINMNIIVRRYVTTHQCYIYDTNENQISDAYDKNSVDYNMKYEDDRITWCVRLSDLTYLGNPVLLTNGCYYIRIHDDFANVDINSTTVIAYKQSWGAATHWVDARNNNKYSLGFNWTSFVLGQRLRTLRISPKYPSTSDTYVYSTGQHKRNYAQTQKIWTWWIDKVDEYTHDVIRLQLLSDTLTIDNIEYFAPSDNYEPEWAENMKRNLSRARVDLQKLTDVLFKRNC